MKMKCVIPLLLTIAVLLSACGLKSGAVMEESSSVPDQIQMVPPSSEDKTEEDRRASATFTDAEEQKEVDDSSSQIVEPQVLSDMVSTSLPEKNEANSYLEQTEKAVLNAINEERKALGLGLLTYNEQLAKAARIRSEELCKTGHWDHTRPNGDSWITVLQQDVPTSYQSAGENLATVKYNDPNKHYESDAIWWFTEWKNSPTHYENMIRTEFNQAGLGIYFEEQEDGMKVAYATTLFAQIEDM